MEDDEADVTPRTLAHYEQRAEDFWLGTRAHDVRQNIAALIRHLHHAAPYTILDFGCGPGRDLKTLRELGHCAIGLDGAPRFVEMARAYSGCTVWAQDFLALDLPLEYFDGLFANASLFHVPTRHLSEVLGALHRSLKPDGVFFSSNPHGNNEAGWHGERYGVYHDLAQWRHFMTTAGFSELEHYYRPEGRPRAEQPWLASVWRKTEQT